MFYYLQGASLTPIINIGLVSNREHIVNKIRIGICYTFENFRGNSLYTGHIERRVWTFSILIVW